MGEIINFDATKPEKVRDLVRTCFEHSVAANQQKNEEFQRVVSLYLNQMDMSKRDPNRSNIFIPTLYKNVETIVPHYVDAILGLQPYIPIKLTRDDNADIGDAMTDLIDTFLDDESGNFFWEFVKMSKYVALLGTGFIESRPDYELRRIDKQVPIIAPNPYGEPILIGMKEVSEMQPRLKIVNRAFAPWEIYQDPYAKSIDDSRWVIKFRGLTSKRQLKKMAERGLFPDFDPEKLDFDMAETQKDDWSTKIADKLGASIPKTDDDMGVWLSYESDDRYIDQWNFSTVLRDIDNPYSRRNKGHGKINLTRVINTDHPNPKQSWYGLGEGKPIEQLVHAVNENWNQTFDNHNMLNQGIIYYQPDALSVDQLVMVAGNRIEVEVGPTQSIDDVVKERDMKGLTRDHYAIPEKLENTIDSTQGIPDIIRGEAPGGERTARGDILRRQAADTRIKLKIKMCEKMGLGNYGLKVACHIDQFSSPDDIIERIGMERASMLPTVNPSAVEGGYRFAFQGSARVADAQIKRQDAKDVYQLTVGNMTIDQQWLAGWLLRTFDIPETELRKALRDDEKMMEMMAQMQAKEGESTRAVSNGSPIGGSGGYGPAGRDNNEKLGAV